MSDPKALYNKRLKRVMDAVELLWDKIPGDVDLSEVPEE